MSDPALDRLFSTSKKYVPTRPLYKFHKLYETLESGTVSNPDASYVARESGSGVYVFNKFFISLLRDHAIWFSPGSQFKNDPWDAGESVSLLRTDHELEEEVLRQFFDDAEAIEVARAPIDERYSLIENRLKHLFRSVRFASFSRQYDCAPMWALYGDNHRGLCLAFQFTGPTPSPMTISLDRNFRAAYPVRYSNDFAKVDDITDPGSALATLYTKAPSWSYEQEVRFMHRADPAAPDAGGTVSFNPRSLTQVILGYKVPSPLWQALRKILDSFGYNHTLLVRAVFNPGTQKMDYFSLGGSVAVS